MIDNLLQRLANFCLKRSKLILIVSLVLVVGALAAAMRIRFDPDLLNLVPANNREINDFKKVLNEMGTFDYHIVVLELPSGHYPDEYESLIEEVGASYTASPNIEEVQYRIPNPIDMIETILPHALLFLPPSDLPAVAELLSDEGIRESVARNRTLMQTPQGSAVKQLVQYDPFNLVPLFLERVQGAGGSGFQIDASSGYYLSTDHSLLLILTKPRRPAHDIPFGRTFITEYTAIERKAVANFRRDNPNVPMPKIGYTGGYAIALGDAELIKKDIALNVLISFFGAIALFIYAFRRVAALGYAGIPMSLAIALTFGFAGLLYGVLSSMSAGFAALLAGLGIDFITVMYGRYVDERNRGEDLPDAIRTIMHKTLPGVFIAAITTAGTFYAFRATDFKGMAQFGVLTGTGILFFLLSVMFVLPALIIETEKRLKGRAPKLFLHSFRSEVLIERSLKQPKLVITLWLIFVVICSIFATRIRFSDNIQDLRSKGNAGVDMQEKLTKKFGQSFDFMMFVAEDKTLEATLRKTYAASADLDTLVGNKSIASYQAISTFLPPAERQAESIRILQEGKNDRFSFERIEKTFRAALVENGFRPDAYDEYLPLFARTVAPAEPMTLTNLDSEDIRKFTSRFLRKTRNGYVSVVYLYPVGGVWPRDVPPDLLRFGSRHADSILTGVNLVSEKLRGIVRADAIRATSLGVIIVFVLMMISFRSLYLTFLTFVPFLVGIAGMLGLMAALNLEINFMNIFVGLMILGCGTDYAVYILQRYHEDPDNFEETAQETGKAVVMAALTTIVAYGSFALSYYPGLRSIGYASTFGVTLSGIAAITLLPAILAARRDRRARSEVGAPPDMA